MRIGSRKAVTGDETRTSVDPLSPDEQATTAETKAEKPVKKAAKKKPR